MTMLEDRPTKPLIDPYCVCGKLHPCPEHGKEEPPPTLFDELPEDSRLW